MNSPSTFSSYCARYEADFRDMTHLDRLNLVRSFVLGTGPCGSLPSGVTRAFVDMIVSIDMDMAERSSGEATRRDAQAVVDRVRRLR